MTAPQTLQSRVRNFGHRRRCGDSLPCLVSNDREPGEVNVSTEPSFRERVQVVCGHCLTPNRVAHLHLGDDPKCGRCGERLLDGELVALDEASFEAFVAKNELPVVVDFWAAWCAPCRMIAPLLEMVAGELQTSVRVAKVDVDAVPALAQRFGVYSIPTLVLFRDGAEVQRIAGAMPAPQLKRWIAGVTRRRR